MCKVLLNINKKIKYPKKKWAKANHRKNTNSQRKHLKIYSIWEWEKMQTTVK